MKSSSYATNGENIENITFTGIKLINRQHYMSATAPMFAKRMVHEHKVLDKEPLDYADAYPDPNNLYKWYFMIIGPESTIYEGGVYLGIITLPPNYPFGPPSMQLLTPSGRFSVKQNICMSNLSYHPESHSPAWTLHKYLVGLISVITDTTITGVGHLHSHDAEKKKHRDGSESYNTKNHPGIFDCPRFTRLREKANAMKQKNVGGGGKKKLFGLF
jgi:ubiquitin-conjugating enzyme E2 J2